MWVYIQLSPLSPGFFLLGMKSLLFSAFKLFCLQIAKQLVVLALGCFQLIKTYLPPSLPKAC